MARRAYPSHVQEAIDAALSGEAADTRPRARRIQLVLPFPPSLNNLYPSVVNQRTGHVVRVKSKAGKKYDETVSQTLGLWLSHHGRRPPLPPYRLTLVLYPPLDGSRHDASNCVKAPEDSLMAAIKGDDNDVVEIHVTKEQPDGYERCVVVLEGEGDND